VRHVCHCADIGHEERRIARCFDPHQFGPAIDGRVPGPRILRLLNKVELNTATLGEDRGSLLVPFTESHQGGNNVVAGSCDGEDQAEKGLRARPSSYASLAPFENCKPFFQDRSRRCLCAAVHRIRDLVELLVRVGHRRNKGQCKGVEPAHSRQRAEACMQGLRGKAHRVFGPRCGFRVRGVNPRLAHEEHLIVLHRRYHLYCSLIQACSRATIARMASWTSAESGSGLCFARIASTCFAARSSMVVEPFFCQTAKGLLSASLE